MRLSRGARKGGAKVSYYGKAAVTGFTDFTSGKNEKKIRDYVYKRAPWLAGWRFSAFIIISVVLVVVMTLVFNNNSVAVDAHTISIAGLPSEFEGYRIVLLSDLNARQFGDNQVSLLRTLNTLNYDCMILAGDMVGTSGNAKPLYELLDGKSSSAPVYFVAGDCDPGPLLSEPRDATGDIENYVLADWILGAMERGAVYLDSPVQIKKGQSSLWLTPEYMLDTQASPLLSRLNSQYRSETDAYISGSDAARVALPFTAYRVQNAQALLNAVNRMSSSDIQISVGHYPPTASYNAAANYTDSGMLRTPDLVLCGHYCGGGIKVPLFGALYVPAVEAPRHGWFPDQTIVEGARHLDTVEVYTTGGLSITDSMGPIRLRINNQPKITILTLTKALTGDLLGR